MDISMFILFDSFSDHAASIVSICKRSMSKQVQAIKAYKYRSRLFLISVTDMNPIRQICHSQSYQIVQGTCRVPSHKAQE